MSPDLLRQPFLKSNACLKLLCLGQKCPHGADHTKGLVKGQLEINPSSQCGQTATLGGWAGGVQNYRLLGNSASAAKTAKSWKMNPFYTHEQHKK